MNSFLRMVGLNMRSKLTGFDIREARGVAAAFWPFGLHRPGSFYRLMALALGTAASIGVSAAPIAPDAQRQVGVYADASECTLTTAHDVITCAMTNDPVFSLNAIGYFGAKVNASANFGVDSMQANLQGITLHNRGAASPSMDLVQFDQFNVTGPSDTVQVTVHGHIAGSAAPSNGDFAFGGWFFGVGQRNPNPTQNPVYIFDWLNPNSRVLYDTQQMWNAFDGPVKPTVDETLTGVMTVSTGKTFEMGMALTITNLNLNVNFSQVQWSFEVPVGYALTSARGISVSAVPEPGSMAMMLAGLSVLGGITARRRRAFSVQGKLA